MEKLPADLKVKVQRSSMVVPIDKTDTRFMFLSNIDQSVNFDVATIHFFPSNLNFPPETVAAKLEDALQRLLVPYDFLAGRLRLNTSSSNEGRLEIDCNSAGAGFIVASSEFTLAEIGDLVFPNPAFRQLILEKYPDLPPEDQPIFLLQVTSFKCGGFAMSISNNHVLMDGISFKVFLENLAAVAANNPLVNPPINDRHLLAARSPPRVTFSHPELIDIPPQQQGQQDAKADANANGTASAKHFQTTSEILDIKVFHLRADNIAKLKLKAKMESAGDNSDNFKITTFNVVLAHIWRCKALSGDTGNDLKKTSTMLYAVDLRKRLHPPLPPSYTGNAVITAYGTGTFGKLKEGPLSHLVQIVSEGSTRITDEYARSIIDWSEFHKGFPKGDLLVSSWLRLGFAEVEYPWGRPKYSCPLVHYMKDVILLFPDTEEEVVSKGVNVLVALPTKEMKIFEDLFHRFLA